MAEGQLVSPVDNRKLEVAIVEVASEYRRARRKFPAMHDAHQGYAILLEEVDELWEAIKANDRDHARTEAIQVGAMIMALLSEVL